MTEMITEKSVVVETVPKRSNRSFQFYIRNDKGFPIACVAVEPGLEDNEGWYALGISVHNPVDRFNRSMARNIACGRAKTLVNQPNRAHTREPNMSAWCELDEGPTPNPTVASVARTLRLFNEEGVIDLPTRVVKALAKY